MKGRLGSWCGVLLACLLGLPAAVSAAEYRLESDTLFRLFESDPASGEKRQVAPAYEYLKVDIGPEAAPGLSFHAYGWGRLDLAGDDYFDDDTAGELLYGYLEYTAQGGGLNARLGRQHIFEGVANEAVDGLRLSGDLNEYFTASFYAGQPVALDSENGRTGDSIYGGRLGHRYQGWYDVGVSWKQVDNDDELAEKMLGVDLGVYFPRGVTLTGFSSRNLETDGWGEHSYALRFNLAGIDWRPYFQQFRYEDKFSTGASSAQPFRFLAESGEEVRVVGADATWQGSENWDLGARIKQYDYDQRDQSSDYAALLATWYAADRCSVGGEAGVMNGDDARDDYLLLRAYATWDRLPASLPLHFVTGEVVWVNYREEIYNQDTSLFLSLGAGQRFLADALEVRLSGDYSSDPYFDHDVRGMLTVSYLLDRRN